MNSCKLLHGDCLELMKKLPDKSIDMILCDPPYQTTRNSWDSMIPLDEMWEQYKRIIKDNGCIAIFSQTPFDKILGASNLPMLKYEWIWEKENSTGFLNAKKMPLKITENILIFYKKPPIYNPQMRMGFKPYRKTANGDHGSNYGPGKAVVIESDGERYPINLIKFGRDKDKLHPTQKPVALLEYLIKTYTNEGMIVLDNCMGSGSTGIACMNTKRNFIGIELDDNYFQMAKERVKNREAELKSESEKEMKV